MNLALNNPSVAYTVRVRAKTTAPRTYLFGSAAVSRKFEAKFVLVIRVDGEGEKISIKGFGATAFDVAELGPGETFALQLENIHAVWVQDQLADTRVHCVLLADPTP
jgi:hypothetical protein